MKRALAIGFAVGGLFEWWWPGYSGMFAPWASVSAGEARIASAILLVGGAILWFMPEERKPR